MAESADAQNERRGDFMTEVNEMNAMLGGPALGERLSNCPRVSYAGQLLATFSILHEGADRPTNYSGMVTRIASYRDNGERMILLRYSDDKGPHQLKFLLANFIRLFPFPRERGGHRFTLDVDGILIKEEITDREPEKQDEGPYAAITAATSQVA